MILIGKMNGMQVTHRDFIVFWFCLAIVGLAFSVFVLSLSMLGLLLSGIFVYHYDDGRFRMVFNREGFDRLRAWRTQLPYFALMLVFVLALFPGYPLEDPGYWLARLRIKLPFLVLPFAFMLFPRLETADRLRVYRFGGWLLGLTALVLTLYYIMHWSELQLRLEQGQPLPLPQNHIRFSLLTGLVSLGLLTGYGGGSACRQKKRPLGLVLGLWLFVFLHILSVRSGLAGVYLALGVLLLVQVFSSRKKGLAVLALFGLLLLPVLAWRLLPSVQTRVGYMLYDWEKFREGTDSGYADSGRFASWQTGWDIFLESPWVGVGSGNLRAAVAKKHPGVAEPLMPHNQWLTILAANGLLGLLAFLPAIFLPLFYRSAWRRPGFLAAWIILVSSFAVESTLENALGVGLFLVFLGLERCTDVTRNVYTIK
jgi:O-antigen ligase